MLPRARRVIMSVSLSVFVLAGLLGAGYVLWDPDPPGDPDTVVLRAGFVGGGPKVQTYNHPAPDLVVYGDGRIIVSRAVYDGGGHRVQTLDARLTRDAYRDMYRDARLIGLGTSRTFDADVEVLDGGSLRVELLFEGSLRRTDVRAGAEGARVWMIERLVERLRELPVRGGDDLVAPATAYRPDRVAVVAVRADRSAVTAGPERRWPLRPLVSGDPASCAVLEGDEAGAAMRLKESTEGDAGWRSGDHLYVVTFRPLLPDQDCASVLDR